MNYFKALFLTSFTLLMVAFASAETRVHPIGVEVTFPDAWVVEVEDDVLFLNESDESAFVMLMVTDAEDVDHASDDAIDELESWVENPQVTVEGREGAINGLDATFLEGTGSMNGVSASWLIVFLEFEGDIVVVSCWGESGEWDPEKGDVIDIIRSIKPSN